MLLRHLLQPAGCLFLEVCNHAMLRIWLVSVSVAGIMNQVASLLPIA
jgi:hypothetical protein